MNTSTAKASPSIHINRLSDTSELNNSVNAQSQHQQQQHHQRREDHADESHLATSDVGRLSSPSAEPNPFKPTRRFWFVLMSISTMHLCGAVEGTIIMNALPTIAAALGGGNLYLWVPNAFYLAAIAVLPLTAQMSDIFGRRRLLLFAMSLFTLGCAIGGASTSMQMLIAARTIQGVGSGAVDTLCETIVLDLVPLRERGKYMSIGTTFGFAIGPFAGGFIVQKLGWPWVFYLDAILGGAALVMFFFSLRLKHQRGQTFWSKVKRIDFGGNFIFIGAIVAVLLALTWGGPVYHWDNARIIAPLVIGLLGLCAFTAFEWTPRLAPEPSFPRILVSNRTSAAAIAITFINCVTTVGTFYFLPVYFQGVLAKSPLASGVALAPIAATIIPFCLVCGILLSKTGKYRPFHFVGWSAILISVGLFTTLDRHSTPAAWASFQILSAAGIGSLTVSMLPAMQAPLSERQAATSAGMYIFTRSFGNIWGVTIPSAIFNNVVKRQVMTHGSAFATADNSTVVDRLARGEAYQLATKAFLDSLPPSDSMVRDQLISIFERALHVVFYSILGLSVLGLLLVFVEKEIPMRRENNTEFGLDEGENMNATNRMGDSDRNTDDRTAAVGSSRQSNGSPAHGETVDSVPLEEVRGRT